MATNADTSAALVDTGARSWTNAAAKTAVEAVLQGNVQIAQAMDYQNLPSDFQTAIWAEFDDAWTNSGVAANSDTAYSFIDPAGSWSSGEEFYTYSRANLLTTHSRKLAHALYVEAKRLVPWSLSDHTFLGLQSILDPSRLYYSWDPEGATPAQSRQYVDHDPGQLWSLIYAACGSFATDTNARGGLRTLALATFGQYSHGPTSGPTAPFYSRYATMQYSWLTDRNGSYVARTGCGGQCQIIAAFSRLCNIPARVYVGEFAELEGNHWSTTHPGLDVAWSHADDSFLVNETDEWADPLGPSATETEFQTILDAGTANAKHVASAEIWADRDLRRSIPTLGNGVSEDQDKMKNPENGWNSIFTASNGLPWLYVVGVTKIQNYYERLKKITGSDGFTEDFD